MGSSIKTLKYLIHNKSRHGDMVKKEYYQTPTFYLFFSAILNLMAFSVIMISWLSVTNLSSGKGKCYFIAEREGIGSHPIEIWKYLKRKKGMQLLGRQLTMSNTICMTQTCSELHFCR